MSTVILGPELTYQHLLMLAERKLGCRKAVCAEVKISGQRLASSSKGGPPIRPERLVKLAIIAGVNPFDALRVGGRAQFADYLEEALRPEVGPLTAIEREMLRELARIPASPTKVQAVRIVAILAGEEMRN